MNDKAYRSKFQGKAESLLNQMSLEEKVYLMSGQTTMAQMRASLLTEGEHYNFKPYPAGGNNRLGIPKLLFCDGPRGVVCGTGISTCFPVSMARGAAFDVELEEKIGNAIGEEVRAHGGNFFGGVCVNLPYHPGWGRSQETYGEDTCLIGKMGAALARGVQNQNVVACVKHYALNSMEVSRFKVNVTCSKRAEREVYTPHFKDCLDAGAASVMTSYNFYQGKKCGHSHYLIQQLLKGEWGFDGFVMSDFNHGVKATEAAAKGGMDVEMAHTKYYGEALVEAVRAKEVPEEAVDQAALRILRTLLAFTETPDPQEYPKGLLACSSHRRLALEAARKSITLIKNQRLLPLDSDGAKLKRLLVLGQLASDHNLGDHGSSQVIPPYAVTALEGIQNHAGEVQVMYLPKGTREEIKNAAQEADAVIVVAGCRHFDEGEYISYRAQELYAENGGDRESIALRKEECEMIQAAGEANKNLAVVLIGGNAILTQPWDSYAKAILFAYYPGMEGGNALGEILFGKVNPSGKLPFTIPVQEEDLPEICWDTEEQFYDYYQGYARFEKYQLPIQYPFGFGLSYTQYEYQDLSVEQDGSTVTASCQVTNIGDKDGEEIVQLYIGYENSSIDRPVKSLKDFQRLPLKAGETKIVSLSVPLEKLKWYNPETGSWQMEHMSYTVFLGSSSRQKDLLSCRCVL